MTDSSLADLKAGDGAYVGADWATRGDWIGRYGSKLAILCAADSPLNHEIYNDSTYRVDGDLGPNRSAGDGLRRWIQWLRTSDPRVLYDPVIGARREAEWDDHGETYPMSKEGPDIWTTVSVPAGIHRLTAYFVNKDGHGGLNEQRDYFLELLPWREDVRDAAELKAFGTVRIREFWGGVHEVFVVAGPAKFYLHVARNNSFNTILCSVMLDKLAGPPTAYEVKHPGLHSVYLFAKEYDAYMKPPKAATEKKLVLEAENARKLWANLDAAASKRRLASSMIANRVLCYRALRASANGTDNTDLLAWWRRSLPMATAEDRTAFTRATAAIYAEVLKLCPMLSNNRL
ncbi:MAG TPA: hypothetical protein VGK19_20175 [Capsulimonadaceae bacterium]